MIAPRVIHPCDTAMQEARHVQTVSGRELSPVLPANTAAAVLRAAGAGERLVEVHDEEAVVDEDFLAFADIARGHDIARPVVPQVWIAGVIDEIVRLGDEPDV